MDREQFRVEPANTGWLTTNSPAVQPVLALHYEGAREELAAAVRPRLRGDLNGEDLDVACRVASRTPGGDQGILTVSDRVTGTHVFEAGVEVSRIQSFIEAVQAYGNHTVHRPQYDLQLTADGAMVGSATTRLLVMYDSDGVLRRDCSLIPREIEL